MFTENETDLRGLIERVKVIEDRRERKKNGKENNKKLTAKKKNRYDVIGYFIIWLSPLSKAVA